MAARKPDARSMRDWDGNLNQKKDLAGYFCPHPFEQMDIYSSGRAVSCCAGWLRLEMGNVKDTAPDQAIHLPQKYSGSFFLV